ncbi:amidase signature enzyme [Penicillium angulare]|uniref:Amidase signature enzyme n=1 Tax=Penicillium angulare TaxID=116970 RepID=A0A9W9G6G1_9EURO|nr:amidase signature enzyme [Penicillium angulare]
MPTTGGSFALLNTTAKRNATLIDRLEDKGLIIIGKTNLSKLGACKGSGGIPGLSAVGGQTQPDYVKGGLVDSEEPLDQSVSVLIHSFIHSDWSLTREKNPGGSSSGSDVAAAAGFAPNFIGGEADGSLNTPASRSALYVLKITPCVVPRDDILTVSRTFETVGGMAKSVVLDLAHVTEAILSTEEQPRDFTNVLVDGWVDISFGFVDHAIWQLPKVLLTPNEEYNVQTISLSTAKTCAL